MPRHDSRCGEQDPRVAVWSKRLDLGFCTELVQPTHAN